MDLEEHRRKSRKLLPRAFVAFRAQCERSVQPLRCSSDAAIVERSIATAEVFPAGAAFAEVSVVETVISSASDRTVNSAGYATAETDSAAIFAARAAVRTKAIR